MDEFDLINRFFNRHKPLAGVGIGDDCALIPLGDSYLAVSKDLLIEGQHFFSDVDPYRLGHKALAVNLSDLAAVSAEPLACFLGIAMPKIDEDWLKCFSDGFTGLAERFGCPLLGGDTTKSGQEIVLSITVIGKLPKGQSLPLRSAAKIGDDIWVSGRLGGASLALSLLLKQKNEDLSKLEQQMLESCRDELEIPQPQIELGRALLGYVNAMVDVSDGLSQDIGHILKASKCGAVLYEDALPVTEVLDGVDPGARRDFLWGGGEAYQLCFTTSKNNRDNITRVAKRLNVELSRIGYIDDDKRIVKAFDKEGKRINTLPTGFKHF